MSESLDTQAVETALEQAFNPSAPKPVKESTRPAEPDEAAEAPEAEPVEAAGDEAADDEPAEADEAEAAAEPVTEPEPEFEIEVNGAREIIKGKEAIKELLQKGRDYSVKTDQVARARESLIAQAQQQALAAQFHQIISTDLTAIQAIDGQLEQFTQIDWATAYDTDPFNALKLREQRDQLREQKAQLVQRFVAKRQQFEQGQAEAAQNRLVAEQQALLAKLPEWRDSESAGKEQKAIAATLRKYGFNDAELEGLVDHRMLLVARKAYLYDQLQAGKAAKVQQVRSAPPVVKPGAAQDKSRTDTRDFLKEVRKAGRQGNHRAQEQLAMKAFSRAFSK